MAEMQGSSRIAADVALTALGPVGASLIVVGILCSTFGSTNGMLLNGPRSMFAASADGSAMKALGTVHPRHHSPWVAVVTLGGWSILLTLSGTYEQITAYVVFGSWFFYGLAAASVIILRRKMPDVERPYKAWGYPYLTLLFLLVVSWFLLNTFIESTRDAVIGILLLVIGLPFYYYWSKRSAVNTSRS
jgi:APA family basic amino acid/polyamine antiporter